MVTQGFGNIVIPRGYQQWGAVDTQVCNSIINAHNNGVKVKDTYISPCPVCQKSAATQINELTTYIKANCASQFSGRIWLDIEGY